MQTPHPKVSSCEIRNFISMLQQDTSFDILSLKQMQPKLLLHTQSQLIKQLDKYTSPSPENIL